MGRPQIQREKVSRVEKVKKRKQVFRGDNEIAVPGDIVQFQRNNVILEGIVLPSSAENSIIVDLSSMDIRDLEELNHGYSNTVVAHKNYRVIEKRNGKLF